MARTNGDMGLLKESRKWQFLVLSLENREIKYKFWVKNRNFQTSILFPSVLDQRPKFYDRSRRFKTYGYGGRSLRPFLRPKVLFIVFLVFFQNGG